MIFWLKMAVPTLLYGWILLCLFALGSKAERGCRCYHKSNFLLCRKNARMIDLRRKVEECKFAYLVIVKFPANIVEVVKLFPMAVNFKFPNRDVNRTATIFVTPATSIGLGFGLALGLLIGAVSSVVFSGVRKYQHRSNHDTAANSLRGSVIRKPPPAPISFTRTSVSKPPSPTTRNYSLSRKQRKKVEKQNEEEICGIKGSLESINVQGQVLFTDLEGKISLAPIGF